MSAESSYKAYRAEIVKSAPPIVPYMWVASPVAPGVAAASGQSGLTVRGFRRSGVTGGGCGRGVQWSARTEERRRAGCASPAHAVGKAGRLARGFGAGSGAATGVYLADLTFIDDGNPDRIDGLINFSKPRLDYSVISNIQLYQQKPFHFRELPQIRVHLIDFPEASDAADKEMYELALELEPRGADRSQIL